MENCPGTRNSDEVSNDLSKENSELVKYPSNATDKLQPD